MLGVVTGLRSEAKLLRGIGLACVSTGGQAHIARAKIDRLIARGASGLVSFGIAGALSPELRTGDLVIADTVTGETGAVWQTHEPWIGALLSTVTSLRDDRRLNDVPHHAASRRSEGHSSAASLWSSEHDAPTDVTPAQGRDDGRRELVSGAILGLDRLLSSPQDKAAAFARTGALAVDMESHHVGRAAAERRLPFIAVRAISDKAGEALPATMATFVDEQGQTKMSAVLAALILGRVKLGELLQAGRTSKRAHLALLRCRGALAGLG